MTHSTLLARFSTNPSTWSNFVVNKFSAVRIPPLGPRLYLSSGLPLWKVSPHALLHDLLVVDCVPDVDVGSVWHMCDSWIEVEDVRRGILGVQVRVESLHQSRLALVVSPSLGQEGRPTEPAIPITMIVTGDFFSPACSLLSDASVCSACARGCSVLDIVAIYRSVKISLLSNNKSVAS